VSRQWLRYALGRQETPEDEPSLLAALAAFKQADDRIPDLLAALAGSDAMRFWKVQP
jgi:hypothetical protein